MSFHLRLSLAVVLAAPAVHAQTAPPASSAPPAAAPATATAPAPTAPAVPPGTVQAAAPADAAPAPGSAPPPAAGPVPYYEEQPATGGQMFVAQPPLPPLQPRNRHFHDGFYLRLSAGYGYLNTSTSLNHNDSTGSLSGSGVAFDILMGGTPAPGLVIGGGLQLENVFDPGNSVTRNGAAVRGINAGSSGSVGFALLGPMIDAFPNPSGGFHFGGLLGFAEVGLKSNQDNVSGGVGFSLWTGYMWWASSQWSTGLIARYSAGWTRRHVGDQTDQFDATDMSNAFAIMFSAAYH
jgi:hypothetical protein